MEIPNRIIITVSGGVAYLAQKPEGCEVVIIDYDNDEGDGPSILQYDEEDSMLASTEVSETLIDSNQQ